MRGSTAKERRADELQTLTFLGLLADDVALAAIEYPSFGASEERALRQLASWLDPGSQPDRVNSPIRRRQSISDPTALLHRAAVLAERAPRSKAGAEPLDFLRIPIVKLLARTAKNEDVTTVRDFAEVLSRVTLMLTNRLESEKGALDWTTIASSSSVEQ